MKKTLIAMAVLAASGASFAQVSITGAVAWGYQATTNGLANPAQAGGWGVDTSALTFTATEDMGKGMKAGASLGLDGVNRQSVGGADTSIFVSGDFGKVTLSSAQGSDYLSGGVAGVAGIGLDGKLFSGLSAADTISYALPAFGPFTVSFVSEEVNVNNTAGNGLGIGSGGAGVTGAASTGTKAVTGAADDKTADQNADKYQRRNGVAIAYAAGALKANAAYQMFDRTQVELNSGENNVSRVRASASYDLGVATLGAGFDQRALAKGSRLDTLFGVTVPVGALSFGAQYGQRVTADWGTDSKNGTRTSTGLKASYSLSPRTSLAYTWVKYDGDVLTSGQQANTFQNLLLAHSF
jgi:hypothetical protein